MMDNNVYILKTNAALKELAKQQLAGSWGKGCFIDTNIFCRRNITGQLLLSTFKFSSLTTSLVDIVLATPVTIGIAICFLKLIKEKKNLM